MKVKKGLIVALVIFGMLTAMAGESFAAVSWYQCDVISAGIDDTTTGDVRLRLHRINNDTIKDFVFTADGTENKILAMALTAISLGYPVNVKVDWVGNGAIQTIQLSAPTTP